MPMTRYIPRIRHLHFWRRKKVAYSVSIFVCRVPTVLTNRADCWPDAWCILYNHNTNFEPLCDGMTYVVHPTCISFPRCIARSNKSSRSLVKELIFVFSSCSKFCRLSCWFCSLLVTPEMCPHDCKYQWTELSIRPLWSVFLLFVCVCVLIYRPALKRVGWL